MLSKQSKDSQQSTKMNNQYCNSVLTSIIIQPIFQGVQDKYGIKSNATKNENNLIYNTIAVTLSIITLIPEQCDIPAG